MPSSHGVEDVAWAVELRQKYYFEQVETGLCKTDLERIGVSNPGSLVRPDTARLDSIGVWGLGSVVFDTN